MGLALLGALSWPATAQPADPVLGAGIQITSVQITSNGWHTGIVLKRADLAPDLLPEAEDFARAAYLEFGWGDAEFYPAKEYTLALTLGAALPSAALMHVAGLAAHPAAVWPGNETIELALSAEQFRKLQEFIHASFARAQGGRVAAAQAGLYRDSFFYPATGEFHLFNTCNSWTARALAAAGLAVDPTLVMRAEGVMAQLRELASSAKRAAP